MSETAKRLFEGLRAAKDVGLQVVGEAARDMGPEAKRLGTQGAMELASALFSQNGFVPYGPGQYTPSKGQEHQQEQQRGGMER
jgi:hypothetical protein